MVYAASTTDTTYTPEINIVYIQSIWDKYIYKKYIYIYLHYLPPWRICVLLKVKHHCLWQSLLSFHPSGTVPCCKISNSQFMSCKLPAHLSHTLLQHFSSFIFTSLNRTAHDIFGSRTSSSVWCVTRAFSSKTEFQLGSMLQTL